MVRPIKPSEGERKRNSRTGIKITNSKAKKAKTHFSPYQAPLILILILLFLFMGSGIGYVWSNYEGTQIGYDLSRLQKEELRLRELNRKYRLELATYKSPQYLEKATLKKNF